MAINPEALTQDLVIMDENSKKVIVVELDGEPIFLKYKDLIELLGKRAPRTQRKEQGTRPLTRIGRLLGDIVRAYEGQGKRVPRKFSDELRERLQEFEGPLPDKINSQVGHILTDLLDGWTFEDASIKKDIKRFLEQQKALLLAPRKSAGA